MSEEAKDPFAAALCKLLAPLARAMVARGLTLAAVTESTKRSLLEAAIEIEGDGVSDSRISVMTGLHRKDVKRLRTDPSLQPGRKTANRSALLIGHWATCPGFQGADGQPRILTREDEDGAPGFNELVRRVRLDVAPGTMVQTLLDQGAMEDLGGGRFKLRSAALLPPVGSEELVAAYQATLTAHLAAATHNLLADADTPRHFDRVVRSSHLSDASVAELEALARQKAQAMLEELNTRALELQARDAAEAPEARGRFAAGAYIWPVADLTPNGGSEKE